MKFLATFLLIVAMSSVVFAANFTVVQDGMTFSPNSLTIDVGDTVEWVHQSGFHTVTSGTGAADPQAGALFDATLSSGSFSFTFNTEGDVHYFCRPHEGLGMTGVVQVVSQVATEAKSFSAVKNLFR